MSHECIFVSIALPTHKDGMFHHYLPWRDGPVNDTIRFAVAEQLNGDLHEVHRVMSEQRMRRYDRGLKCPTINHFTMDNNESILQYFIITQNEFKSRLWLKCEDYIAFLEMKIAEFIEDCHPYAIFLENLRDFVKLNVEGLEGSDVRELFKHPRIRLPALSIPKSRYDQFMAIRAPAKRQRVGQAFHDYMQADKCTQDKDWWNRLYQADDILFKVMIMAVLDWDQ